ncbi:TerB family tellurite resistance protein [Sungkyunkwania multivorans]|uniref:TerB family tellurite resistance protein n=1 Tax=Sungkyunkwania multivorans TaxID=1173618 RepID=A0ABW3CZS4_9FLAO
MDKPSKLSLLSDLIALARVSDGVKDIEHSFLVVVANQMGISETDLKLLYDVPQKPVPIQPEANRILHFHRLVLMMNVDRDTDALELVKVKNFGLRMGLSQEAVTTVLKVMDDYPNKVVPPDVLIKIFKTQHN